MNTVTFLNPKWKPPSPVDGIHFEPLWYNSYVTHNSNIITDTVVQQFISSCIIQVNTYVKSGLMSLNLGQTDF